MARVIFLATVLVALCYSAQAFPPGFPRDELEKLINDKKELVEKLKGLKKLNEPAAAAYDGQGEQYFMGKMIGGIIDGALRTTDEALNIPLNMIKNMQGGMQELQKIVTPNKGIKPESTYEPVEAEVAGLWNDMQSRWEKTKDQLEDAKQKGENKLKETLEDAEDKLNKGLRQGTELLENMANQGKQMVDETWQDLKDKTDQQLDDAKKNLKKIDEGMKKILN